MSYLYEFKIVGINRTFENIQEVYLVDSIDKKEVICDILNIDIAKVVEAEKRTVTMKYTGVRKLTRTITIKDHDFNILESSIKEIFIKDKLDEVMRVLKPNTIKFNDNDLIWKLLITKTIDQQFEE